MRTNRWLIMALAALFLLPMSLLAQAQTTVSGRVTNAAGEPAPGVLVRIAELGAGTTSGADGTYRLTIPSANVRAGQSVTLTATRQGLATVSRTLTLQPGAAITQNVQMTEAALALDALVVTALGITREERAVSTSVTQIESARLVDAPETNIVNALAGEVAGLQTTNAGPAGGSARVVIRGATSLSGDNQPLFVVDGVPIDNSAPSIDGYGGFDYGNAAQDINPNDISTVTVLKGPTAAALYGSRAANGVILITTKNGRGVDGTQFTLTSNMTFEDPLRLPSYQNQYGQGANGEFSFVDGAGGGTADGVDESWGPACDGTPIPQFFSNGQPAPFVCHPDNVANFFETGLTTQNNLAFTASGERANLRLSLGQMRQDGMYPGQELNRYTVGLNGGTDVTSRLRAEASANYIRSDGQNRPGTGYSANNPMQQFVWFGRSVDTRLLREYQQDGQHYNWNYNYHTNPYWLALRNRNEDERNRIIGNVSLSYELNDWLSVTSRTGTDWYQDERKRMYHSEGINFPYDAFAADNITRSETNSDLFLAADRDLSETFSVTATLGGNYRRANDRLNYISVEELTIPGVFTASNAAVPVDAEDWLFRVGSRSVYGSAQLGFRDLAFLEVTGRNDWSSTLPDGNNSYFYPSVSGSVILSDAFDLTRTPISYLKLRAGWAQVGDDADPYQLQAAFLAQDPFNSIPAYAVPDAIANADLKPELTEAWEIGADLQVLDGRLGFEATFYDQVTRNQILAADVSAASGFLSQVVNAGAISNQGFELRVTGAPIQTDDFRWNIAANYSRNRSKVEELFGDLETYQLGTYWGVTTEARVGDPYGSMYGEGYLRDDNGRVVVDADGIPMKAAERVYLGNYSPDWIGSLSNTFGYKGVELSFLLDTRVGGEIFSVTNMFGNFAGVLDTSLPGRENSYCDPGVIFPGVTESGEENETSVCPETFWFNQYFLDEPHIFDASYTKLREARLSFNVPQSLLSRTRLGSMNVALVGRNLWLWTKTPHIDPETAFDVGNSQGFEFGQLPTGRSIGLSITVTP
jgi:TonB-linked SusC/RagA family outer membrane protein